MRIAVLADVHGNASALRAVLADIDRDPVDEIVIAGDVVGGPFNRESLELLRARPERKHWIRGNVERSAIVAFDASSSPDGPPGPGASWTARTLDQAWRDEFGSWPIALSLDGALFCHGSPRSEDEIITPATPEDVLCEVLAEVEERLVVGGHTHRQFIRSVASGHVWANAGSVGVPFEGRTGAFWMIVQAGHPELRETAYDASAALEEIVASGFPNATSDRWRSLADPVDPDWMTAHLEHRAGRGDDPGEPPGWPTRPAITGA
jgi:predicted phosphodiesterase